jgi:lipoprotein-releasing system permease protein
MTLLFAWRYFKAKKSTNAINIISWISVLAIAVGAAALILVLSVFNGFEGLVKSLYADFYADVRVAPAKGKFLTLTADQINRIKKVNGVKHLSLVAEEKAVLVNEEYQSIIYLKGVDQHYTEVSGLAKHTTKGKFDLGKTDEPLLVIGAGIENAVGIEAGRSGFPLTVYLPNRKSAMFNGIESLNSYNANVSGSFALQQDFDNKYAITNLSFIKYMLDLGEDQYSAAELRLTSQDDVEEVTDEVQKLLGPTYTAQTRYQQNLSLYSVMQVEKWVIYGILSLILVVAAFNMIGALTMLVLEKQKDIAVLRAMGADNSVIQKIFLNEGFLLAAIGGGSGILLATLICFIQVKFKIVKLSGGSFIIDYYPVQMLPADFILVIVTILVIALVAAFVPSKKASDQFISLKS